jgi:hypothetical protein
MAEGLDRHDAIHAVGSIFIQWVHDADAERRAPAAAPEQAYFAEVDRLSAAEWLASARQSSDPAEMDIAAIVDELALRDMPVNAIRAARAQRVSAVPAFLAIIERYLDGSATPVERDALFLVFHLLGEWREKSAYPVLARLLRRPEMGTTLGNAVTETCHRVMVAVFDVDPQPLYEIVLDQAADEFVRSRMCEAIAILTLRNGLRRAETMRFLEACYSALEGQDQSGNYVWVGWLSAIAALGATELKALVEQAFARGFVDPMAMNLQDFERELQRGIEKPGEPVSPGDNFSPFGDTIAELSSWSAFAPESERDFDDDDYENELGVGDEDNLWHRPYLPVRNPMKGVGRNDPCPCGSGKKFKKCCLERAAA